MGKKEKKVQHKSVLMNFFRIIKHFKCFICRKGLIKYPLCNILPAKSFCLQVIQQDYNGIRPTIDRVPIRCLGTSESHYAEFS